MKKIREVKGKYITLRPISFDDAEFVVNLRNNPRHSQYIEPGVKTVKEQLDWMRGYFEKDNDHYFIIVWNLTEDRIGTIAIYKIDFSDGKAEWGRWIVDNNPLAALESVYLIYKYGFEVLNLKKLYFTTVVENLRAVRIHEFYGARRIKILKNYSLIRGSYRDEYYYEVDRKLFDDRIKPSLLKFLRI